MEYKEILGGVSAVIALGVSFSYIYTIVRGKTKPHLYTHLIDVIISSIVFFGALTAGAGAGVWVLAVSTPVVFVIVLLSLKYGTKDVTRADAFFAVGACLSIIPWLLTKDPTLSIALATLIYVLSMAPTIRKTWNDAYSEPLFLWVLNALKHVIAIFAITAYSVATLTYSVSIICINAVLIGVILWRRRK
jgi:hypothetical protein